MRKIVGVLLTLGMAAVHAAAAQSRVGVGADVGVYSAYIWRGLTMSSGPVLQPDVYLTYQTARGGFSVGGWSNIELGQYDDPQDDLSQGGGLAGPDLTELDWWADYTRLFGTSSLSVGVTGYTYPNDAGLTSDLNTIELYAQLSLGSLLNPAFSAYYAVDGVEGLYLEAAASHDLPVTDKLSLILGLTAGFSVSQSCGLGSVCGEFHWFQKNSFTHFDVSAGTAFEAVGLSISPVVHFQLSADKFAKINSPSHPDENSKVWFGATVSWVR